MTKRKRLTRKKLAKMIEILEQQRAAGEWPGTSDEALIQAVMAHHGWSYEEARKRLELSGM
jgi:hypothetical protein